MKLSGFGVVSLNHSLRIPPFRPFGKIGGRLWKWHKQQKRGGTFGFLPFWYYGWKIYYSSIIPKGDWSAIWPQRYEDILSQTGLLNSGLSNERIIVLFNDCVLFIRLFWKKSRAGDGNRTRDHCLEGRNFTSKLHPQRTIISMYDCREEFQTLFLL